MRKHSYLTLFILALLLLNTACTTKQLNLATIKQVSTYPTSINAEQIDPNNPIQLVYETDKRAYLVYTSQYTVEVSLNFVHNSLTIHIVSQGDPLPNFDSNVYKITIPNSTDYIIVFVDGKESRFDNISF